MGGGCAARTRSPQGRLQRCPPASSPPTPFLPTPPPLACPTARAGSAPARCTCCSRRRRTRSGASSRAGEPAGWPTNLGGAQRWRAAGGSGSRRPADSTLGPGVLRCAGMVHRTLSVCAELIVHKGVGQKSKELVAGVASARADAAIRSPSSGQRRSSAATLPQPQTRRSAAWPPELMTALQQSGLSPRQLSAAAAATTTESGPSDSAAVSAVTASVGRLPVSAARPASTSAACGCTAGLPELISLMSGGTQPTATSASQASQLASAASSKAHGLPAAVLCVAGCAAAAPRLEDPPFRTCAPGATRRQEREGGRRQLRQAVCPQGCMAGFILPWVLHEVGLQQAQAAWALKGNKGWRRRAGGAGYGASGGGRDSKLS